MSGQLLLGLTLGRRFCLPCLVYFGLVQPLKLDVSDRPDLARKYGVAVVPAVFRAAPDGAVLERLAP